MEKSYPWLKVEEWETPGHCSQMHSLRHEGHVLKRAKSSGPRNPGFVGPVGPISRNAACVLRPNIHDLAINTGLPSNLNP